MSVLPIQPIGPVVLVLPADSAPLSTASGITLADVTYDPSTSGTIVAVGSRFCCESCDVVREVDYQVGDRVLFGRGAGSEIDGASVGVPGESLLLLKESELLAVLPAGALCEVV